MTGAAAFNRLFDETMATLTFDVDGETLGLEATLSLLQSADRRSAKARKALAATFAANIRTFTLITNTLAKDKEISDRWHKFEDIADSRHLANRVEREVVDALAAAVKDAYPRLSHRYYAMKAKWLGMDKMNFWDRNAPLPETPDATISWDEARETVLSAYGAFSPDMAGIARPSSTATGSTRRCVPARRRAPLRIRQSLRAPLCARQLHGQAARCHDAGA